MKESSFFTASAATLRAEAGGAERSSKAYRLLVATAAERGAGAAEGG